MKKIRHQVKRIQPDTQVSIDGQFWPVLMAICVVAAIAAGAIVSLMSGMAMWVSLLLLPAVAVSAVVVLYQMDDSILRRSLQFAILLSLGIHLLILMVSSLLTIFSTVAPEQTAKLIRTPEKKIQITNRTQKLVIHETNKTVTPDNPVEAQKTQTNPEVQRREVPVTRPENSEERQVSQRRKTEPVIPRKDRQLSQRRRSQTQNRPTSSSGQVSLRSKSSSSTPAKQPEPSPTKTEVRKSTSQTSSSSKDNLQIKSSATASRSKLQRRAMKSSPARESKATARKRTENAAIPRIANRAEVAPRKMTALNSPTAKSPKLDARRQATDRSTISKTKSTINHSPKNRLQQSSARRITSRDRNSIQSEQVSRTVSRNIASKTPTTPANLQPVRNSVASDRKSRNQPQPKSFSMTRSTRGMAGAGRSSNLQRSTGGESSPVQIASDASHRRQSNRTSENVSLSSLQKSSRADTGRNSESQRVLKSDTTAWAALAGGSQPAEKSIRAAAATVDSAVMHRSGETAAEKGASMLDIGTTKVVAESTAERRSGGGAPDLSDSLVRNSSTTGGRNTNNELTSQATMTAHTGQTRASSSSQVSLGDGQIADFESRTDREVAQQTLSRSQTSPNETGSSEVGRPIAMSQRRDGEESVSTAVATDKMVATTSQQAGNTRSNSSQAPSVSHQVNPGNQSDSGSTGEIALEDGISGLTDGIQRSQVGTDQRGLEKSSVTVASANESTNSGTSELQRRTSSNRGERLPSDNAPSPASEQRTGAALAPTSTVAIGQPQAERGQPSTGELQVVESDDVGVGRQDAESRFAEAGMQLAIDAQDGAAGLSNIASRRAGAPIDSSVESDQLSPERESRFVRKQSGGSLAVVPNVVIGKEAFRKRNPGSLASSGPSTEAAIELGLAFLARHQLADGSWTLGQFDVENPLYQNQLASDTAATGLALLAFQGAGYNHREYKYAAQVKAGVEWLIRNQSTDGGLYVESNQKSNSSCRMYSHAIAALALAEAYGMTQDEQIRGSTQRALDYIAKTQDPEHGGWRYYATPRMRSTDTSVTGWMMMALKSGQLAGLEINSDTLERISGWLRVAQSTTSPHQFRYNPYAIDSPGVSRAHGREVSTTMTSVGLLMRVYSGWKPDDARFLDGAKVLLTQLPGDQNTRARDTYYWYYATQVLKHAGGEYWEQWRSALHPLLIGTQEKNGEMAGSWHPYKPVPDRWAPQGGRLYVTTMNLLSLEVKYRLLPLYEKTID